MSTADLAARLRRSRDSASISPLRTDRGRRLKTRAFPALPLGVRPEDVDRSGWTVVFHRDEDIAVRAALERLITYRQERIEKRVAPLTYYPDDSVEGWLGNLGVGWGNIAPEKVPYYLLIVGAPSRIPYQFVQTLDAEYRVGLLDLPDAGAYQRYAQSVVGYEKAGAIENKKEIVYFGTRHPFDDATTLSADWLVAPLAEGLPARPPSDAVRPVANEWSFAQRKFAGDDARRQALLDVLTPADKRPPALLFTATHGMVWPNGHERQLPAQGALLCQDWSGFGNIATEHYLAAADVPDAASVSGVIAFLFACYGGGTPLEDRFAHEPGAAPHGNRAQTFCGGAARPAVDPSRGRSARLHRARRTGMGVFHLRPDHGAADRTVPPGPGPPDARTAGRPGGAGVQRQVRRGIRVAGQSSREGLCRTSR